MDAPLMRMQRLTQRLYHLALMGESVGVVLVWRPFEMGLGDDFGLTC